MKIILIKTNLPQWLVALMWRNLDIVALENFCNNCQWQDITGTY